MFGNYQMWSSFLSLWTSELYVANEDQEWSWLTQAQMAQWHQEDEKWLKARAAEAAAAEARKRSRSVADIVEESMPEIRQIARLEVQLEASRARLAHPDRGPDGPAMD